MDCSGVLETAGEQGKAGGQGVFATMDKDMLSLSGGPVERPSGNDAGRSCDVIMVSCGESGVTNNAPVEVPRGKRAADRARLMRGRNAMAAKQRAGEVRIQAAKAAMDLSRPDPPALVKQPAVAEPLAPQPAVQKSEALAGAIAVAARASEAAEAAVKKLKCLLPAESATRAGTPCLTQKHVAGHGSGAAPFRVTGGKMTLRRSARRATRNE